MKFIEIKQEPGVVTGLIEGKVMAIYYPNTGNVYVKGEHNNIADLIFLLCAIIKKSNNGKDKEDQKDH